MTDRPIMFSAPMVKALLYGCKTQTRRLASSPLARCRAGDRLWVRETWGCHWATDNQPPRDIDPEIWSVRYAADKHIRPARRDGSQALEEQFKRLRPGIHMPRWASRLTLEVEGVLVERLGEISDRDAQAEGVELESADPPFWWVPGLPTEQVHALPEKGESPRDCFRRLWELLHGDGSWAANPEVVAIKFSVQRGNIDRGGA